MALEIERKFLVKQPPAWYQQFPHKEIIQWYLTDPSTGKSIRVRKIDNEYKVTKKRGSWLVREEIETSISKEEFDQLWIEVDNRFLEKTRYYIPYQWYTIEFDVYKNLNGLLTAEVEFTNKRDAKKFEQPERFDEDITMMREASNAYIATHGIDGELKELL